MGCVMAFAAQEIHRSWGNGHVREKFHLVNGGFDGFVFGETRGVEESLVDIFGFQIGIFFDDVGGIFSSCHKFNDCSHRNSHLANACLSAHDILVESHTIQHT